MTVPPPPSPHQQPREFLRALYNAAVVRALPGLNTAAFLPPPPRGRTLVLGAGKAGVEDNAGAIVTPSTLVRAAALGLKAPDFLDRNDACNFFKPLGDLVVPGPTFTNVNDFRALLVV